MGGMLKFIHENFLHVGPILGVGVFGLAIAIERIRALIFIYPLQNTASFFETVGVLILTDRVSEALLVCDHYGSKPIANVVRAGLMHAHQTEAMVEHSLEIAVGEASDRIRSRTGFLSTIANVATLLGLLGTVMGLVQSFEAVGSANAQARSSLLAAGISTAMNATILGLAIAIPCMIAYSFLMNRTNRLTAELNRAAIRVIHLLNQRYFEVDSARPRSQTYPNAHAHPNSSSSGQPQAKTQPRTYAEPQSEITGAV
jgi:biopolymer transport protein ExbB/TolQ